MTTVLIIGASGGMGLHWVRHYKEQGFDVIATTRDPEKAVELRSLLSSEKDQLLKLDVTEPASVTLAMSQLNTTPDITIYNAGVKGYQQDPNCRASLSNATWSNGEVSSREAGREHAFQVNAYGVDRVLFALKDRFLETPQATFVYIGTGVADIAQNRSGHYPFYRESKLAGTAFARSWDLELLLKAHSDSRPRIFSLIPGLVDAGMGADCSGAAPAADRIAELAKVIQQVRASGDTHGAWSYDGTKTVVYDLPECIVSSYGADRASVAEQLSSLGIYNRGESSPSSSQSFRLR